MALTPDRLKAALGAADHPLGLQELLRSVGVHPGAQTALKRMLRELVREGVVVREGKRFALREAPSRAGKAAGSGKGGGRRSDGRSFARAGPRGGARGREVEGLLSIHRDGFGFVKVEEGEDIYLSPAQARRALDSDRVRVEVVGGPDSTEGRLVQVLERVRREAIGTYLEGGDGTALVQPRDASLQGPIRVPPTQLARNGDVVKVTLGVGGDLTGRGGLFGEVSGVLGTPGHPSQDVLSVALSKGFSDAFADDVMEAADRVPLEVGEADATGEGRRDLRRLKLVTIDGEDARDFDDAVYAEPLGGGGTRLWVAIADVTHYVRESDPLDHEALFRGTSVYLPDRVLPMLPERLSNGICSLRPEVDRLCMVAEMDFDARARMGRFELYPAVMRSAARCTYEEVQDVLDGRADARRAPLRRELLTLAGLARALRAMRVERGAIDFDLPETKVLLDERGYPARIARRERRESHRLVEECMLAANEAVAKFFLDRELPSVYRFHGEPDLEKLETFAKLARAHGFAFEAGRKLTSKQLNDFVQKLEGHPEQRALNQLLLRSMMQAVYSAESVGHYGLAAEQYLHFTSPIRRYPDLLVHRLLKEHWRRRGKPQSAHERERQTERLESMAMRSSERERAAMQVEREVNAYYATLLMRPRVGETFAATVSSVVEFGFFVELDAENVEGLVRAETLGRGAKLNPELYALVFPDGRKVRVGQKLSARLAEANLERRQLSFEVVAFEGEREAPSVRAPGSPHPGFDRLRKLGRVPQAQGQRKGAGARHGSGGGQRSGPPDRNKGRRPKRRSR